MSRKIDEMSSWDVAKYVKTFCENMAEQFERNDKHDYAQAFWIVYNEVEDGLLTEWDD